MKRLFILKDNNGHSFIGIPKEQGPLCFTNKKEAKERRDEINAQELGYKLHVSYGPDHRNYDDGR